MADGRNDHRLSDLHDLLIQDLSSRLKDGEDVVSKSGEVTKINASTATLKLIYEILKDAEITSIPTQTNPIGQLAKSYKFPVPEDNA